MTDLIIHSRTRGVNLAWTPKYTTFEVGDVKFYRGPALRLDLRGAEVMRLGGSFRDLFEGSYLHSPFETEHLRVIHGGFQLLQTGRAVIVDFVLCGEDVNEVDYAQKTIEGSS